MAEHHVGKKRRKEVREAIDMRQEIRRTNITVAAIAVVIVGSMLSCTVVVAAGVLGDNAIVAEAIALLIVFAALGVLGYRMNGYWNLRDRYREHCRKFNISKEDMKALERGQL